MKKLLAVLLITSSLAKAQSPLTVTKLTVLDTIWAQKKIAYFYGGSVIDSIATGIRGKIINIGDANNTQLQLGSTSSAITIGSPTQYGSSNISLYGTVQVGGQLVGGSTTSSNGFFMGGINGTDVYYGARASNGNLIYYTNSGSNTVATMWSNGHFTAGNGTDHNSWLQSGLPTTSVSGLYLPAGSALSSVTDGHMSHVSGHLYFDDGTTRYDLLNPSGGSVNWGSYTTTITNVSGITSSSSSWASYSLVGNQVHVELTGSLLPSVPTGSWCYIKFSLPYTIGAAFSMIATGSLVSIGGVNSIGWAGSDTQAVTVAFLSPGTSSSQYFIMVDYKH